MPNASLPTALGGTSQGGDGGPQEKLAMLPISRPARKPSRSIRMSPSLLYHRRHRSKHQATFFSHDQSRSSAPLQRFPHRIGLICCHPAAKHVGQRHPVP
jgi:hypothetical protein